MKVKNIYIYIVIVLSLSSCYDLLNENPKDFLTPDNSYMDKKGFESALSHIYLSIRNQFYALDDQWQNYDLMGVDVDFYTPQVNDNVYNSHYYWNTLNADNGSVKKWWNYFYGVIFNCNTIIDRSENPNVFWSSESEKNAIVGEAKFLRAFAYRFLANMWGNVPLVLTETTTPKFDYKNVKQEDVYMQCKEDLEFAIKWMPDIDNQKGGRASKVAAQHLLTEILIGLKDYEKAIQVATDVINNPAMSLMTERFGSLKDFEFEGYDYQGEKEPWGDVYFDLFCEGNFNRIDGNRECIWNVQFDPSIEGGGNTSGGGNFNYCRWLCSSWWTLKDLDGVPNFLKSIMSGRPVGGVAPTSYVSNYIWNYKDAWNEDMRNSKYNIKREYYWTNPDSRFYGEKMNIDNLGNPEDNFKITQPTFNKLIEAIPANPQFKDNLSGEMHNNGKIFKDWYIMRLAETYLLRAEANLLAGDLQAAANDVNVIRNRAHATLVTVNDMSLDLILDERARELFMEDFRLNTLMRMNKLTEYLMKYNPYIIQGGYKLDDHLNKFPIPNSEIEANKEGGLIQNPGY